MGTITLSEGTLGFDTSTVLSTAQLQRAWDQGYRLLMKYIPYGTAAQSKFLSAAERDRAFAIGFAIILLWEVERDNPLGGADGGTVDGAKARRNATALGYPEELPIVGCVDYDVWAGNRVPTEAYCRAFATACGGPPAFYGDQDLADTLIDLRPLIFLPNAWGWSRSLKADKGTDLRAAKGIPGVVIYQRHQTAADFGTPVSIDPDIVLNPVPAWTNHQAVVPHVDVDRRHDTELPTEEDTMATSIITVEGRNAQFIGTGTKLPDGSVHCVMVAWFGPGRDTALLGNHAERPDVVHERYTPDTVQRDLVLVGSYPQDIQDTLHAWTSADFAHAIDRP